MGPRGILFDSEPNEIASDQQELCFVYTHTTLGAPLTSVQMNFLMTSPLI